jgi:ubiquinol-cytochrome c reductase cytochrome b subunit
VNPAGAAGGADLGGFLHFLVILPVLGFKEKTIPVPLSITEPILGGTPNLAMAKNKERLDK